MIKITPSQRRKIFALSREQNIDSEDLHAFVYKITRKKSLKTLTIHEAIKVINSLSGEKYTYPGTMSDGQYNHLEALAEGLGWLDASGKTDTERLDGFILSVAKVSKLEWVSTKGASDAIEAFKAMKRREQKVI